MSENLNEIEKMQLAWMDMHPIQDKDGIIEEAKAEEEKKREQVKKFKPRKNPAAWNFPEPEQEIDLHGYVAEEAAAAVENLMEGMRRAGLSVLRIIHGGGNPEYGNVKRIIDQKVATVWRHKVSFYKTEPNNSGSSIMKINRTDTFNVIPRDRRRK
ncbi:Smr domain-containing protein [Fibrobacter intestinalis]|uniref:Smr domain-containing protein n=1 Tax=Fibrobacter intestinalis TaxID=28122 RepID=A0A1M6V8J9_9BACT|nr:MULTISPECIES: Smr/MutS family protein [Fibrobacter]MDD7299457.1 Smr/MutS family protein [Fibrobacter intestinalis]PBC67854.1 Smr domain-containing protein [Fibrobacter sp. UWS1]PBC72485.1 Smr domain-containing protein [Fibrobacter sp. NR9]SHK77695.1 Smr domain-containing protein [Fibrobacter intestinalis]SKA11125.1 Smr domain-containing protein [Fibrobacter intestinalis]